MKSLLESVTRWAIVVISVDRSSLFMKELRTNIILFCNIVLCIGSGDASSGPHKHSKALNSRSVLAGSM